MNKKVVCIKTEIVNTHNDYVKWHEKTPLERLQVPEDSFKSYHDHGVEIKTTSIKEFRKRIYKNNHVKNLSDALKYIPINLKVVSVIETDEYIEFYMYVALCDNNLEFIESIIFDTSKKFIIDKDSYVNNLQDKIEDLKINNYSLTFIIFLIIFGSWLFLYN